MIFELDCIDWLFFNKERRCMLELLPSMNTFGVIIFLKNYVEKIPWIRNVIKETRCNPDKRDEFLVDVRRELIPILNRFLYLLQKLQVDLSNGNFEIYVKPVQTDARLLSEMLNDCQIPAHERMKNVSDDWANEFVKKLDNLKIYLKNRT